MVTSVKFYCNITRGMKPPLVYFTQEILSVMHCWSQIVEWGCGAQRRSTPVTKQESIVWLKNNH